MSGLRTIKKQLKELGFGHNETKVYVALTQLGESNATDIAKKADLPRTTAISILKKMEKEKYISIQRYRGRSVFWIESPKMLKEAFENRAKMADELSGLLAGLYHSESDFPYAKIYDSKASIKAFIEKTLLNMGKKGEICTIETPNAGNYSKIVSEEFLYLMLDMKKEKGIITKSLVNAGSVSGIDPRKMQRQSIVLREMPKDIQFKASFWIIKDMLVLFSGKYPFVVAVNHRTIAGSMKSIFDYIWSISIEK